MTLPVPRDLALPPPASGVPATVCVTGSIVIVGGNGSGKTRLGSWLDLQSPQAPITHRVAAQKSLTIPPSCSTSSLDIAENGLLYGYAHAQATQAHKVGHKWGQNPSTHLQSDYEKLLTFLFTDEFEQSTQYRQQAKDADKRKEKPPETKLDTIKCIWESVLPHRELLIRGGKIEVQRPDKAAAPYHAAEMSDGERVIFYLIGQSLAAKKNGIVVIDEPELHLHRSLQARLWDAVEAERPDCLFVYLTHDLDFAATRINATKIWLRGYEGERWDWHVLPTRSALPDRLLLEILGSRKPILFVEGDRDSLEQLIFSRLYPDHTVAPCGGASEVIHATCSFAALKQLHNMECFGIVDRDFRPDAQVEYLRQRNVLCLEVSEIENVLLEEGVLGAAAAALHISDVETLITKAKAIVFDQLACEKDRLVSAIVAARIEMSFSQFDSKAVGVAGLSQSLTKLVSGIDVSALFASTLIQIDDTLHRGDYKAALRVLNNKGLLPRVADLFGFKARELTTFIRRLMLSKDNAALIAALKTALPEMRAPADALEPAASMAIAAET